MCCVERLVAFVQFKKREKGLNLQPATLLKLTLFHECFSRFSNCTNATKSRNASQIREESTSILFKRV